MTLKKHTWVIPDFTILFDNSFEVLGQREKKTFIPNFSTRGGFFLYDVKNKRLIKINFLFFHYSFICYGRKVFFLQKKNLSPVANKTVMNSWKKYFYKHLYNFFGYSNVIFHFVGMGYKIRRFKKRKKFRLFFWVGYCTWQVLRIPFFTITQKNRESFRLLSFKMYSSSFQFKRLVLAIKNIRLAEPYKGKGIRFKEEFIKRKPGKSGRL